MAEKRRSNVVIFTCSWYPAIAADNAGVTNQQYPSNTRIITLACAGRLTPALILDAFGAGARGVLVAACKTELCHYVNGSLTCKEVVEETKDLVALLGIGAKRLHLETFDSEDGQHFAEVVSEFCGKIEKLGMVDVDAVPK